MRSKKKNVRSNKTILPKLKKIDYTSKKHLYKLNLSKKKRRLALDEGVLKDKNKMGKRKAATSKKARLNILRIYRRFNDSKGCNKITSDMKYLDKKYKLGETKNICFLKKGGTPLEDNNEDNNEDDNEDNSLNDDDRYMDDDNNTTLEPTAEELGAFNEIQQFMDSDEMTRFSFMNLEEKRRKVQEEMARLRSDTLPILRGSSLTFYQTFADNFEDTYRRLLDVIEQENKLQYRNIHYQILGGSKGKLMAKGRTRKKNKKKLQFLYNPNDPKKSFDVYIDKNPNDTIPIKYTTIDDVKSTIKKLEHLYKTGKYPHKRIWQVGMIMKVRLESMKKHKKKLYPNAKKVNERTKLAQQYFYFLKERSKEKDEKKRKKMIFTPAKL